MKFNYFIILGICFFFIISVTADFSYEDLTFQHTMRVCNSSHCADLLILNNSFAYTDLNPSKCFELGGGIASVNFIDLLIANFPIILFVLIILSFIVLYIKKSRKEILNK